MQFLTICRFDIPVENFLLVSVGQGIDKIYIDIDRLYHLKLPPIRSQREGWTF
jgi:hypothetical protein